MARFDPAAGLHSKVPDPKPPCPQTLSFGDSTASTMPILRRVLDVALASAVLVFVAPLMLLIALLVSLDGAQPILSHTRLGARSRPFQCLKFRTVVPGAEQALKDLLAYDEEAAEYLQCSRRSGPDPRETWIGHFLRVTDMDELPQLFNVLRGDMSLLDRSSGILVERPGSHTGRDGVGG